MADVQQITAEIKSLLESSDGISSADVNRLAPTYASLCESCNDRLRRIADYLRKGLLCEAVYHAEIEPDLNELFTALDIPRADDWRNLCVQHEAHVAPRLLVDVAAQLGTEYTTAQTIEKVAKKLRVLSLAHAPVAERLRVVSQMAQLMPDSADLEADVVAFERARQAELIREANRAFAAEDLESLERVRVELESTSWAEPLTSTMLGKLREAILQVCSTKGVRELKSLVPRLHDEHSAMEFDKCSALLAEWDGIVSVYHPRIPDDLAAQVQPVRSWVAEQRQQKVQEKQFARVCTLLAEALGAEASTDQLKRLHRQAEGFEHPIPAELQNTYVRELTSREVAKARRTRLVITIGLFGFFCLAGIVGWVLHRFEESRRLNASRVQITTLLDGSQIDQATQAWKEIAGQEAGLAQRPDFAALKKRLDEAISERESHRAEHARLVANARMSLAERDIDAVRKHARTAEETKGADELTAQMQEHQLSVQRRVDQDCSPLVVSLKKKIASFDVSTLQQNPQRADQLIQQYESELLTLEKKAQGASQPILDAVAACRSSFTSLVDRVRSRHKELASQEEMRRDYDRLPQSLTSPTTFSDSVKQFLTRHPQSPRAAALAEALERRADWDAIWEWQAKAAPWITQLPDSADEVRRRQQVVREYRERWPASPLNDVVSEYGKHLARAEKALGDGGVWNSSLPRLFADAPAFQTCCVKNTRTGKVYYYLPSPTLDLSGQGARMVPVILDIQKKDGFNAPDLLSFPAGEMELQGDSPIKRLAGRLMQRLKTLKGENASTIGFELIDDIMEEPGVPPAIRLSSLSDVVTCMQQCDADFLKDAPLLKEIPPLLAIAGNYTNPDDEKARGVGRRIQEFLEKTAQPQFAVLHQRYLGQQAAFLRVLVQQRLSLGILVRDGSEWSLRCAEMPPDAVIMGVVAATQGKAQFCEVGQLSGQGQVAVETAVASKLPELSLVFLMKRPVR